MYMFFFVYGYGYLLDLIELTHASSVRGSPDLQRRARLRHLIHTPSHVKAPARKPAGLSQVKSGSDVRPAGFHHLPGFGALDPRVPLSPRHRYTSGSNGADPQQPHAATTPRCTELENLQNAESPFAITDAGALEFFAAYSAH